MAMAMRMLTRTRAGRVLTVSALTAMTIAVAAAVEAQPQRPRADVVASAPPAVVAGRESTLTLTVKLPGSIHVQSDKPRDAALIATALKLDPPPGVTVGRIEYPAAEDLAQAGQGQPLSVFGPTFTIAVRVTVAPTVAGPIAIPGTLRYQACDTNVCYPPAKAPVTWATTATGAM